MRTFINILNILMLILFIFDYHAGAETNDYRNGALVNKPPSHNKPHQ